MRNLLDHFAFRPSALLEAHGRKATSLMPRASCRCEQSKALKLHVCTHRALVSTISWKLQVSNANCAGSRINKTQAGAPTLQDLICEELYAMLTLAFDFILKHLGKSDHAFVPSRFEKMGFYYVLPIFQGYHQNVRRAFISIS
jgi:hypothetical protein